MEYRVIRSREARRLMVRVGPRGVEVVRPDSRSEGDIAPFLHRNEAWILRQIQRTTRLRPVFQQVRTSHSEILLHGEVVFVQMRQISEQRGQNRVVPQGHKLVIQCGKGSRTPPRRTLENWLRKEARREININLQNVLPRLKKSRGRLYIMAQRTKWGNCSAMGNLSFNWRLIMAPEFALRYIVVHEAVHLVIRNHSQRFWLTVQSLCSEMEHAKQWLSTNRTRLMIDLESVFCEGRSC